MQQDIDNLKLVSIFHYVVACFAALIACFPIIHLSIGLSMLTGGIFNSAAASSEDAFPVGLFGLFFTIIPSVIILMGWAYAICLAVSGHFLSKHSHYLFCLVMAGISCTLTPFGTVLGVFTIILLSKPAVKGLFNYPKQNGETSG